jgi:hypothetical protein
VLLLALCACNQVFDLHRTHLALPDGAAKPDPTCPDSGPPRLGVTSHVVLSKSCNAYSPAETMDLALTSAGTFIYTGPIDSDMVSLLNLPTASSEYLQDARLGPEGDRLIVLRVNSNAFPLSYELFRSDAGVWTHDSTLPIAASTTLTIGVPSRFAAGAHVVVSRTDGFHELVDDGTGTWPERHFYDATMLTPDPSAVVSEASLTPDGLRMVFFGWGLAGDGVKHVWFAQRLSIDDPFTLPAQPIDVPGQVDAYAPYLTENCGKLYYSDNSTIYLSEQ